LRRRFGKIDFIWIFAAGKQILPLPLGEKAHCDIRAHANFTARPGLRQHFKLLVGARVFAGKTQKFEERCAGERRGIISTSALSALRASSQAASSV